MIETIREALVARPWFWWPIIAASGTAIILGFVAYAYTQKHTYPREAKSSGFKGMVRETAKFTVMGSGAGLLVSILDKELEKLTFFKDAMLAILVVSLVAAILNYWMASALDTRETKDGKAVSLSTPLWEVVHGMIFGLSITAAISLLAAIIGFAIQS